VEWRRVSAVETDAGRRLAEAQVKRITGGEDKICARFLRQEVFEFNVTSKIYIATNHRPEITGTDNGIWDRIRLVPFTVVIPEGRRDPALHTKLKRELP